jgi:hypothetical protein
MCCAVAPSQGGRKPEQYNRQKHLSLLSQFCRRPGSQQQLAQLQDTVTAQLQALLIELEAHYKKLSQEAPQAPTSGSFRAGVAAVGDTSRELASLHNLIERLKKEEPEFEVMMAANRF